jgi:hypothetical protein
VRTDDGHLHMRRRLAWRALHHNDRIPPTPLEAIRREARKLLDAEIVKLEDAVSGQLRLPA